MLLYLPVYSVSSSLFFGDGNYICFYYSILNIFHIFAYYIQWNKLKLYVFMKSDIQIAHETKLERIENVAAKIGIDANELEHYGKYIAKIPLNLIGEKKGKLVLVTAITATKAGIGKTTVSIGIALGLNKNWQEGCRCSA